MQAFSTKERAKEIRDLGLTDDALPAQRSQGACWDLERDSFTFRVTPPKKPFTCRGVLSIVNSIYDPFGLAIPVLLEGRLLLQQLVAMGKEKNKGTVRIYKISRLRHQDSRHAHRETIKIHSCVNSELPTKFVDLLNKGSSFIPTKLNFNVKQFTNTVSTEVKKSLD